MPAWPAAWFNVVLLIILTLCDSSVHNTVSKLTEEPTHRDVDTVWMNWRAEANISNQISVLQPKQWQQSTLHTWYLHGNKTVTTQPSLTLLTCWCYYTKWFKLIHMPLEIGLVLGLKRLKPKQIDLGIGLVLGLGLGLKWQKLKQIDLEMSVKQVRKMPKTHLVIIVVVIVIIVTKDMNKNTNRHPIHPTLCSLHWDAPSSNTNCTLNAVESKLQVLVTIPESDDLQHVPVGIPVPCRV